MFQADWDRLTETDRRSLRQLVRLAARRDALGRKWAAGLLNVPRDWGMPEETLRREWLAARKRAQHLVRLLARVRLHHGRWVPVEGE
jgi:hypothetical protein